MSVPRSRVPHDPIEGGNFGDPCNICGTPWPCEERRAQREVQREVRHWLREALFQPGPIENEPGSENESRRWDAPLGWSVYVRYGETGLAGAAKGPDGTIRATEALTVEWLEQAVP